MYNVDVMCMCVCVCVWGGGGGDDIPASVSDIIVFRLL